MARTCPEPEIKEWLLDRPEGARAWLETRARQEMEGSVVTLSLAAQHARRLEGVEGGPSDWVARKLDEAAEEGELP